MHETRPVAVILTALPSEYMAVRSHLADVEERIHPEGTRVERGRLPGTSWEVAVAELGEGAVNAAALTERIVNWQCPEALFFVGVAGGLKDDITIGDVVVGTKVYGLHGGKVTPDGQFARPESWRASHRLDQAARSALRGKAHFKPIACGDVVLADSRSTTAAYIKKHFNDAVAIEMEGSGAAHAAHLSSKLDALVIRAVSDRADAAKHEADASGSQSRAAVAAAAAAVAVLQKHKPYSGRGRTRATAGTESPDSQEDSKENPPNGPYAAPRPKAAAPASVEAPSTAPFSPARPTPAREGTTPHTAWATRPEPGSARVHGPVPLATAELPAPPRGFTGRDDDLARLLPLLDPAAAPEIPVVICAVSGLGGIGKTSLALYAAHQAVHDGWFPGGTLFVDLRGYDDNPVTADQALLALLDALGVHGTNLPQTTHAQYALYRSLLAQRPRMLLLLDNASAPDQLTQLLPHADHHRVLITSRDRLTELDAQLIDLDILTSGASVRLITTSLRLGDDRDNRPAHEPEALRKLAAACGHHPLALQMAAAMLRRRRHRTIASLVDEIWATADLTDRLALRPIFDISYARLSGPQARMLRLLGLAPTSEAGTEVVTAMADLTTERTLALLEDLDAARFVTPVTTDGIVRWRLHDLVRAYAAGVARSTPELAREGEAGRERALRFYCRWVDCGREHVRWVQESKAPDVFTNRDAALAWLDSERASLVAAAQWITDDRCADAAISLALRLWGYLDWRRYYDDWATVSRAAQQAAARLRDSEREAMAWDNLGLALTEAGRAKEAIAAHDAALDLHQAAKDRRGEAKAWNNLGLALQQAGRLTEAIDAHTRDRDFCRSARDHNGEAVAWNNLGAALRKAGRLDDALAAHDASLDLHQAGKDRQGQALAWNNLGLARHQARRWKEAIVAFHKALNICWRLQDSYGAGENLYNLGVAHRSDDHRAEARAYFRQSAAAFRAAGAGTEAARADGQAEALQGH